MSFGFSPGDIVLFIGFATKVVGALKDGGGSRSEYQFAERQCQDFFSTMDDIQRLDLSNVPDSFRAKIEQHAKHTQEFIAAFKKTIDKYEKSMGKSSQRGSGKSAPRKVQWAFSAADDLDNFRKCLSAQLHLVHITISTSILSIVANSQPSRQRLQGPQRPFRASIDWGSRQIDGFDTLSQVDNITNLVYERLLLKGGLPLGSQGRIHTLPDDFSINLPHTILDSIQESNDQFTTEHPKDPPAQIQQGSQTGLASELNEYLRSFNLEELSDLEAEQLVSNEHRPHQLLGGTEEPPSEPAPPHPTAKPERPYIPPKEGKPRQRSRFRPSMPLFGIGADIFGGISLASSLLDFIQIGAATAFQASTIYRNAQGAPQELSTLSRRISQYTNLLQVAAGVIHTSIPAGDLQELGWEVVRDSKETMDSVSQILSSFLVRDGPRRRLEAVVKSLKWSSNRKRILDVMEQFESLKSTLSVMLQMHHVQMTEWNFAQMTERNFAQMTERNFAQMKERNFAAMAGANDARPEP